MRSELPGGVQISMVTPLPTQKTKDTMKLSLDDIIIAGLERQPEETNYKCTKAFAEQFDQPIPKKLPVVPAAESIVHGVKRHSLDTEHGSPGDSDYESSQEAALASSTGNGIMGQLPLPFKIRKNSSTVVAIKKNVSVDGGDQVVITAATNPTNISTSPSDVTSFDSRIQKSIKDFFITS